MKKLFTVLLAVALSASLVSLAQALDLETLDIDTYSVEGTIDWNHTYDFTELSPFYLDADLLDWTIPLSMAVESSRGVEIETPTLAVQSAVPEPRIV